MDFHSIFNKNIIKASFPYWKAWFFMISVPKHDFMPLPYGSHGFGALSPMKNQVFIWFGYLEALVCTAGIMPREFPASVCMSQNYANWCWKLIFECLGVIWCIASAYAVWWLQMSCKTNWISWKTNHESACMGPNPPRCVGGYIDATLVFLEISWNIYKTCGWPHLRCVKDRHLIAGGCVF